MAAVNVRPKYRRHHCVHVVEQRYITTGGNPDDPIFSPTQLFVKNKEDAWTCALLCIAHSRALEYQFTQVVGGAGALYCVREHRNNRKGRRLLGYVNIPATLLAFKELAQQTSHRM